MRTVYRIIGRYVGSEEAPAPDILRNMEAKMTPRDAPRVKTKTYNSEDSLVVTHPTTNSPACGLSTAERTGSPVFHTLWSRRNREVREGLI
ncbi:hypothetical protein N7449_010971 [Penicillium cf. viridicatum]|uniref:Uncharacterized protein n=1 Tax=Penicillium cf. viridicatum TaxID=2972119 RepID=A0A9W9IYD6_9EURO|nr:hypothetical protein N7449_010971 [Penicillium cf. viridicatum]